MADTWVRYNQSGKYWEFSIDNGATFNALTEHHMAGDVGVGTTAPDIDGAGTIGPRLILDGDTLSKIPIFGLGKTEAGVANTYSQISFFNRSIAGTDKRSARFTVQTDGAANSARLIFFVINAGAVVEAWRVIKNGFMGILGVTPNVALDVNGDVATRRVEITLANGDNNNIATGAFSYIRLSGPTGAFALTGFAGGFDGKILMVHNNVAQTMTVKNANAGSTAANRIKTLTGADVVLRATANSFANFIYDSSQSLWILMSIN